MIRRDLEDFVAQYKVDRVGKTLTLILILVNVKFVVLHADQILSLDGHQGRELSVNGPNAY